MRSVPDGLTLAPMPDDFAPEITDDGKVLRSAALIEGSRYELGLRPSRLPVALEQAMADLRAGMWQLREFARLGRFDLMQYASVDRHQMSPGRAMTTL